MRTATLSLTVLLLVGCARVPRYSGTFQGPVANLKLVDQKSQVAEATGLVIQKADFTSKAPPNEIAGLRVLLVNRNYECLNLPINEGEVVHVKGTLTSWPPKNPATRSEIVRVEGRTNLTEVLHVVRVRSVIRDK